VTNEDPQAELDIEEAAIVFTETLLKQRHIRAAIVAGFTFGLKDLQLNEYSGSPGKSGFYGHIEFRCVCGRAETPHFFIDDFSPEAAVRAGEHYGRLFHDTGAFSIEHLLYDNYTQEEAERINSLYTRALGHE
jgi:hypothetical protein